MPDGGLDLSLFRRRAGDKERTSPVVKARAVERRYAAALRRVAKMVGEIVRSFRAEEPAAQPALQEALRRYSEAIDPWAKAVAGRMLAEVAQRDRTAWREFSATMSRALRQEIENAPTGMVMRADLDRQVGLIKSLPVEAGQRVQRLALEARITGKRASEVAKEIANTEGVTKARAELIARTEVSRAATSLTQARAQSVGSEGYIWRTAQDAQVRPSHKAMNGKFVRWDNPPTLDGLTGHAGAIPNCRCIPLPVLPED